MFGTQKKKETHTPLFALAVSALQLYRGRGVEVNDCSAAGVVVAAEKAECIIAYTKTYRVAVVRPCLKVVSVRGHRSARSYEWQHDYITPLPVHLLLYVR